MATDGQSKFLYTSEGTGSSQVGAFSISGAGALAAVVGSPFPFDLSAIAGEPSGKYLLGVTGVEADNHIHVLGISTSGALAEVSGSPFSTTYSPVGLTVHPNGAWVYTFNQDVLLRQLEPIEGFEFSSATGDLAALSGSPFSSLLADGGPIDPSGQFMFALGITLIAGNTESTVTPYAIDTNTGNLNSTLPSLGFPGVQAAAYAVTDVQ